MESALPNPLAILLNRIAGITLLVFTGLYWCLKSQFAEKHFYVAAIGLPIFVGELLLFGLFLLWLWRRLAMAETWQLWHWAWVVFGVWLMIKALTGVSAYGVLALRNAALFYYAFFVLLAFEFFRNKDRSNVILFAIAVIVSALLWGKCLQDYAQLPAFLVLLAIALRMRQPVFRAAFIANGVAILLKYKGFSTGTRAHMIGYFLTLSFLSVYFLFGMWRAKRMVKLGGCLAFLLAGLVCVLVFADRNAINSFTRWDSLKAKFTYYDTIIREGEAYYIFEPVQYEVFTPDQFDGRLKGEVRLNNERAVRQGLEAVVLSKLQGLNPQDIHDKQFDNRLLSTINSSMDWRSLDTAQINALYRVFIWRDMWRDLLKERAWWGINWGIPQRSKSLEILGWNVREIIDAGWIVPHNSFFHMVYRAGWVGIGLIGVLMVALIKLTSGFLAARSFTGGLLLAILCYWIGLASFSLFLEVPYTAIPFWSLLGFLFAYFRKMPARLNNPANSETVDA